MLKRKIRKFLLIIPLLACATALNAQDGTYTGYTPYSLFGVGDISKQGTAFNKGMAGTGIATRNNRYINYLNPAAVTARDSLAFMSDFGISVSSNMYKQGDLTSGNNTANIYDFIISFPIYRSSAMYVGITPYSSVGYSFSSYVKDKQLIGNVGNIAYTSSGNGGLYNLFLGAGVTFWDKLSLGAEGNYYFGNIDRQSSLIYAEASQRSVYSGYNLTLHGGTAKFGVQYEQPAGKDFKITAGATYKLKTNLSGYAEDYQYASISSVSDTLRYVNDTLSHSSTRPSLGSEIGVGVSLKYRDKLTVELDYLRSDWSESNFDKLAGFSSVSQAGAFSTTVSESFRGGFEFTPNRNDIRYYYRRITYRGGAYYDKAYYMLNNNPVKSVGLTFGATLPVFRWYNGLTLGVDMGQRGYATDHMVRERYINFSVSLNIFDIWFRKPTYE